MSQRAIPVHVGSEPPLYWDDVEARQQKYGEDAAPALQDQRRPTIGAADVNFERVGFEPRWLESDTADCAVALQPSIFTGHGADEFARFRRGARSRGETALVISPIGEIERGPSADRVVRNVFGPPASHVSVGGLYTSVSGVLLGPEAVVHPVPNLGDADAQLARRLATCRPTPRWRSLTLEGAVLHSTYGGQTEHPAEGRLLPILQTELGEPVVAAWISPDEAERRYIVPVETPWRLLLQWLMEQALPEFVPGALRRARRDLGTDASLTTTAERAARDALAKLEAEHSVRRNELARDVETAETFAAPIREGLLYGFGQQLVDAVQSVLEAAGIVVVDLDKELGGTKNADLLCSYADHSRLVEVKGASSNASERSYEDLLHHLREWPTLTHDTPIDGGALIVNHEYRKAPAERSRQPFRRPEFLQAQTEPIIATLALFDAWRNEDWRAIRQLIFGAGLSTTRATIAATPTVGSPLPGAPIPSAAEAQGRQMTSPQASPVPAPRPATTRRPRRLRWPFRHRSEV